MSFAAKAEFISFPAESSGWDWPDTDSILGDLDDALGRDGDPLESPAPTPYNPPTPEPDGEIPKARFQQNQKAMSLGVKEISRAASGAREVPRK